MDHLHTLLSYAILYLGASGIPVWPNIMLSVVERHLSAVNKVDGTSRLGNLSIALSVCPGTVG